MNPLTITILYSLLGNQYCSIMLNNCPILEGWGLLGAGPLRSLTSCDAPLTLFL